MEQDRKVNSIFSVGKTPYCLWDPDIKRLNSHFLNSIDHKYFEYVAHTNSVNIEGIDKHRGATALRSAYHHGLETLFALICSLLQAPDCVVGWVLRYRPQQLRSMVSQISKGEIEFPYKLRLDDVTWESIADFVLDWSGLENPRKSETKKAYGKLWKRFAHQFTDEYSIGEYNSLKHGFRTGTGGFAVAVGRSNQPPAEKKMHTLGSSEFGHTFFTLQHISEEPDDPNIQVRRSAVAWDPIAMGYGLVLISFSIQNVVSFLKLLNDRALKVQFARPENDEDFERPFADGPSVPTLSIGMNLQKEDIQLFTRPELDKIIRDSFKH